MATKTAKKKTATKAVATKAAVTKTAKSTAKPAKRPVKAILDCRGVTHINYQALNLIKHYHRKAWINMGRLTIVGLSSKLCRQSGNFQVDHGKIFDATIDDALAEIKTLIYT